MKNTSGWSKNQLLWWMFIFSAMTGMCVVGAVISYKANNFVFVIIYSIGYLVSAYSLRDACKNYWAELKNATKS